MLYKIKHNLEHVSYDGRSLPLPSLVSAAQPGQPARPPARASTIVRQTSGLNTVACSETPHGVPSTRQQAIPIPAVGECT